MQKRQRWKGKTSRYSKEGEERDTAKNERGREIHQRRRDQRNIARKTRLRRQIQQGRREEKSYTVKKERGREKQERRR